MSGCVIAPNNAINGSNPNCIGMLGMSILGMLKFGSLKSGSCRLGRLSSGNSTCNMSGMLGMFKFGNDIPGKLGNEGKLGNPGNESPGNDGNGRFILGNDMPDRLGNDGKLGNEMPGSEGNEGNPGKPDSAGSDGKLGNDIPGRFGNDGSPGKPGNDIPGNDGKDMLGRSIGIDTFGMSSVTSGNLAYKNGFGLCNSVPNSFLNIA